MKTLIWLLSWLLLLWSGFACWAPSTYSPSASDEILITSLQPKIDSLFDKDPLRGNVIMMKLKDISMNFETDTKEYYILRELHLYMNSKINEHIELETYEDWVEMSSYMLYSPETFQQALDQHYAVVINFRASRCPRCKATSEEIIAHQAEIPDWVIVLEADYDETKELQAELWVIQQTTFVFFNKDWEQVGLVERLSWIDQLLEEISELNL